MMRARDAARGGSSRYLTEDRREIDVDVKRQVSARELRATFPEMCSGCSGGQLALSACSSHMYLRGPSGNPLPRIRHGRDLHELCKPSSASLRKANGECQEPTWSVSNPSVPIRSDQALSAFGRLWLRSTRVHSNRAEQSTKSHRHTYIYLVPVLHLSTDLLLCMIVYRSFRDTASPTVYPPLSRSHRLPRGDKEEVKMYSNTTMNPSSSA